MVAGTVVVVAGVLLTVVVFAGGVLLTVVVFAGGVLLTVVVFAGGALLTVVVFAGGVLLTVVVLAAEVAAGVVLFPNIPDRARPRGDFENEAPNELIALRRLLIAVALLVVAAGTERAVAAHKKRIRTKKRKFTC